MDLATKKMVYYGLLGLLIAGSTIAVFREAPQIARIPIPILVKDGTLLLYFNSIPSDISGNQGITNNGLSLITSSSTPLIPKIALSAIISLDVTIDSVMVHQSGSNDSGWTRVPQTPVKIDLLKSTTVPLLINSVKIPEENITMIELHVSNAMAVLQDPTGIISVEVTVSSGNLKIPLDSGVSVKAQMSTSIVVDRPHIVIEGNGTIRLTPVLSVDRVDGPK